MLFTRSSCTSYLWQGLLACFFPPTLHFLRHYVKVELCSPCCSLHSCYSWAVVIQFCIVNNTAALISEAAHPCHFELNNLVTTVFYCTYTLHIVVTFLCFWSFVALLYIILSYCWLYSVFKFRVSISPEGLHIIGFPVLKHFMPWVLGCSLNLFPFLQKKVVSITLCLLLMQFNIFIFYCTSP